MTLAALPSGQADWLHWEVRSDMVMVMLPNSCCVIPIMSYTVLG